jgi:hypothetical protein
MRPVEIADVMVTSNSYIAAYVKCLAMTGSPDQLLKPNQPTTPVETEDHNVARLQSEIKSMEYEFMLVQEQYGQNMLKPLVVVG